MTGLMHFTDFISAHSLIGLYFPVTSYCHLSFTSWIEMRGLIWL